MISTDHCIISYMISGDCCYDKLLIIDDQYWSVHHIMTPSYKPINHADVSKSPWNVCTIGRIHFLTWLIIITSVYHHKFSTQVQDLKQKRYILIWSLLDNNVWAWSRSCLKDLPSFVHYHQNTILIKRLTSWSSAKIPFSFLQAPHHDLCMTSIKGLRRNWTI